MSPVPRLMLTRPASGSELPARAVQLQVREPDLRLFGDVVDLNQERCGFIVAPASPCRARRAACRSPASPSLASSPASISASCWVSEAWTFSTSVPSLRRFFALRAQHHHPEDHGGEHDENGGGDRPVRVIHLEFHSPAPVDWDEVVSLVLDDSVDSVEPEPVSPLAGGGVVGAGAAPPSPSPSSATGAASNATVISNLAMKDFGPAVRAASCRVTVAGDFFAASVLPPRRVRRIRDPPA